MQVPSPSRCSATRADGRACTAWATKTGFCAGHSGLGVAADPSESGFKGADTRRENAAKRRLHAERREMTLAEALAEKAAEERDALVEALFGPVLSDQTSPMEKHRASIAILERMLGKPKEPAVVETTEEELPLEVLVEMWKEQKRQQQAGTAEVPHDVDPA